MSVLVESAAGRPLNATGVSVVVTTRSAQGHKTSAFHNLVISTKSKQIEHVQFASTLSKGRNFTIESFDIVAVCGYKVERCFDIVAGADWAQLPMSAVCLLQFGVARWVAQRRQVGNWHVNWQHSSYTFITIIPVYITVLLTCFIGKDYRALVDGLHVTSYGSDFVSLGWTAPESSTADLYQVRYRSDKTAVNGISAFTVQPNITVWSLQPGTTYSFAVCQPSDAAFCQIFWILVILYDWLFLHMCTLHRNILLFSFSNLIPGSIFGD